jgi:CRP-like cAMP-binding protein
MEKHIMEAMRHCPLFVGMTDTELDLLMEHVAQCRVYYSKGQVIRRSGEPCRSADIIIKGELLARMVGKSNHEVEVCRLDCGDIISPAFIFADDRSMPVTVIATRETEILRLEPDELSKLIDHYPLIRTNYIKALSNIITFLTKRIKVLVLFTAKEKVAQLLLEECNSQHSTIIHLDKSRQELADSFGIQKNSLIRALNDLTADGAIEVRRREITIIDKEKLL